MRANSRGSSWLGVGHSAGALIGTAGGDGANEKLQIEIVRRRTPGPTRRAIRDGWAGSSSPKSSTGSMMPMPKKWPHSAIGRWPGEKGIVGGDVSHSASDGAARSAVLPLRLLAVEKVGLHGLVGVGNLDVRACLGRRAPAKRRRPAAALRRTPEKKAANSQNCLRSSREGMIVALGAFELDAEEQPRRAAARFSGLRLVGLVEGDGVGVRSGAGADCGRSTGAAVSSSRTI